MAFVRTDLHAIGGQTGDGPTMYAYTTTDAMTVVRASGYFNDVSTTLNINDLIYVVSASGGTPAPYFTYVNGNASGVVDVVDGLAIPTTDTD